MAAKEPFGVAKQKNFLGFIPAPPMPPASCLFVGAVAPEHWMPTTRRLGARGGKVATAREVPAAKRPLATGCVVAAAADSL